MPQHNSQSHRAREVTPEKDCIAAIVFSAPSMVSRGGAGLGGFACRERLLSFDDTRELTQKLDAFYHHPEPAESHSNPHRPSCRNPVLPEGVGDGREDDAKEETAGNRGSHLLGTAVSSATSESYARADFSPDFVRHDVRTPWTPKRSERTRNTNWHRNTLRRRYQRNNNHHKQQRPPLQIIPVSCVSSSSSIVPSSSAATSSSGGARRRRQRETTHSYRDGGNNDGKPPGYHCKGRQKHRGCWQSLLGTVFRTSTNTRKDEVRKPSHRKKRQQQPQQHVQYHPSKGHHHKNRYFTPPQLTENYHPHPASSIVTSRTLV